MEQFLIKKSLGPCILTRDDIKDIVELILYNFNEANYFSISTNSANKELSEETVEKFLENKSLPNSANNLHISRKNYKANKSLYLSFGKDFTYLRVEGDETLWVNSKYLEIRDFLKNKLYVIGYLGGYTGVLLIKMSLFGILGYLIFHAAQSINNIPKTIIIILIIITTIALIILADKLDRNKIILKAKDDLWGRIWSNQIVSSVVAMLIIAILFFLIYTFTGLKLST